MIIRTFEKFIRCSEGKQFKSAMAWKHVVLLNGIFLMLVEFVGNRLSVRLSVCLSVGPLDPRDAHDGRSVEKTRAW